MPELLRICRSRTNLIPVHSRRIIYSLSNQPLLILDMCDEATCQSFGGRCDVSSTGEFTCVCDLRCNAVRYVCNLVALSVRQNIEIPYTFELSRTICVLWVCDVCLALWRNQTASVWFGRRDIWLWVSNAGRGLSSANEPLRTRHGQLWRWDPEASLHNYLWLH